MFWLGRCFGRWLGLCLGRCFGVCRGLRVELDLLEWRGVDLGFGLGFGRGAARRPGLFWGRGAGGVAVSGGRAVDAGLLRVDVESSSGFAQLALNQQGVGVVSQAGVIVVQGAFLVSEALVAVGELKVNQRFEFGVGVLAEELRVGGDGLGVPTLDVIGVGDEKLCLPGLIAGGPEFNQRLCFGAGLLVVFQLQINCYDLQLGPLASSFAWKL